jgi:DNA-binding PadR family transcriptional regulator
VFHLLLALREGEQHGYALMHRVEDLTDGTVRMGPGTLYGAIKRMLADGLIEESDERPDPALDDQRRRYYRITAAGERACAAEVDRLETLLRNARLARTELGTA